MSKDNADELTGDDYVKHVREQEQKSTTVTAEQLLTMLQRSEVVSADRLVILRSMEGFFNSVDQARTRLLADIQEINNSIAIRDSIGKVSDEPASEEE